MSPPSIEVDVDFEMNSCRAIDFQCDYGVDFIDMLALNAISV